MFRTVDFYLGIFLVISGFAISLLNLQSILKGKNKFSQILLSENLFLICIGLAFILRAVYSLDPYNISIEDLEDKMSRNIPEHYETLKCGFPSLFLSYGPLILSLVNSFISLIIDNYMHFRIMIDEKTKEDENTVENLRENVNRESGRDIKFNNIFNFFKTHFSLITVIVQWLSPIIMTLFLFPMNVKEVSMSEMRDFHDNCIAMLDLTGNECLSNQTLPIHKYISTPMNYTKTYDYDYSSNKTTEINSVLNNVFKVLSDYNNNSDFFYTQISKSARTPKYRDYCMNICFTDNKSVLLYMFTLTLISFFVPITISTFILTKIHMMNVKKAKHKTYVTKEVLYNILFWSPVMLDTFLSLILCSFSMLSTRTSLLNAIANIYQVIKNFLNTQHFKENIIVPV